MSHTQKLSITLPGEVAGDVERLMKESGETRSGVILRVLRAFFRTRGQEARIHAYVEGYRRHPESAAEVKAAEAAATELLAQETWE